MQAELQLGRLTLVPGVRYDHFSMDADQSDPVYIASLKPGYLPTSPMARCRAEGGRRGAGHGRRHAACASTRAASGRRPTATSTPGSRIRPGGYTTLPNAELAAEKSHNFEGGVRTTFDRASFEFTAFTNQYDQFIELTTLGFNPRTRLLEFQAENLSEAEINGIELRGEAYLNSSVVVRGAYARIKGVELLAGAAADRAARGGETPLGSIAPERGRGSAFATRSPPAAGAPSCRCAWSESYQAAPDEDQFAPGAYQILDLVGNVSLVGGSNAAARGAQPDGRQGTSSGGTCGAGSRTIP